MKIHPPRLFSSLTRASIAALLSLASFSTSSRAAESPAAATTIDDFSDAQRSAHGIDRILVDDKNMGGQSSATQEHTQGTLRVTGSLSPARGMPGWISLVIPMPHEGGAPRDLTQHEGLRIRVKVLKGMLSVQACSSEVQNFDYHVSAPLVRKGDDFQEIRIPFRDLKRAFSEQTPLNLKTIVAVNLVAAGMAKGEFSYEVDEITLY